MNYQEGDVVQFEKGNVVYVDLPRQFGGYGIGNFEKLTNKPVVIGDTYYYLDTSFLIGKWIITRIEKTSGSYGHGPGDYYPPETFCKLQSIEHEDLKCTFYPYDANRIVKNTIPVKVIGKAHATWSVDKDPNS